MLVLARCAQGNHEAKRNYGVIGIIFAVILFPVGLLCLAYVSSYLWGIILLTYLEALTRNGTAHGAAYA
jgi:hypothetical protein